MRRGYYLLNEDELKEALGRKPEDSLDDYKGQMCVPFFTREELGITDDKDWETLSDGIMNDDELNREIDIALSYFKRNLSSIKPIEEKIKPHRLDIVVESRNTLQLNVSDEDYEIIKNHNGKIPSPIIRELIFKNEDSFVKKEEVASRYFGGVLDCTDENRRFRFDIEDSMGVQIKDKELYDKEKGLYDIIFDSLRVSENK